MIYRSLSFDYSFCHKSTIHKRSSSPYDDAGAAGLKLEIQAIGTHLKSRFDRTVGIASTPS
jgi:hypothetical protein